MENFIFDKSNGLWYELHGDYYLPCLTLPEQEHYDLGRFARAHHRYLQQCHRATPTTMKVQCTLNKYLHDMDGECEEMFSRLVKQLAEGEGVTEELKASDQIEWVRRMNNIRNRAEEIVKSELVYV